jgi:hypothetical protein
MKKDTEEIKSIVRIKCWRESQARRMLDIWKQSDRSLLGFCRQYRVGYKRLLRWRRILEEQPGPMEFVEVDPFQTSGLSDDRMEICLTNGRSIRIRPGFNNQALRRVIDIAEEIVCG